jgi:predicted kinase
VLAGELEGQDVARLIVLAGLPGTGKSTIAREVARRTGAIWLRIDSLSEAIRASGVVPGDLKDVGYRAAYAAAEDNLRLGSDVIGDCVNDWKVTRDAWQAAGRRAGADVLWAEIVCSDPSEHRRRIETRVGDVPGLALPDWAAVIGRDYHPWDRDHLTIETAGLSISQSAELLLAAI